MPNRCPHLDKLLGMGEEISRRDFLDGALLASGAALLAGTAPSQLAAQTGWAGYTGEGDYQGSAGNAEDVVRSAHAVRDGKFDQEPVSVVDTKEVFDCVIVGGGFAGLSAALFFKQRTPASRNCLVLDNARVFGGVAKRNEFVVEGHRLYAPQASVHFQPPYPDSFLKGVYDSFGLDWDAFKNYQTWAGPGPDMDLSRSPYRVEGYPPRATYGFYFGAKYGKTPGIWVKDPWRDGLARTPFSEQTRREFISWHEQRHATAPLVYDFPGDSVSRELDSMTLEDYWVRLYGISRETIRLITASDTASGFGLGPDALSAWLEYEWSRNVPTVDDSMATGLQMFPGGNCGMNRMIVKTLIPEAIEGPRGMETTWKNRIDFDALDTPGSRVRLRLGSTAVRVEHEGEPRQAEFVRITYTRGGKVYQLKAKTVVMAGGGWITKHVVRDLNPERRAAYDTFSHSPYLVANVAVRNWRFLSNLGLSGGNWFEGFGRFTEVRKCADFGVDLKTVGPALPTVLTFFVDFSQPGLPVERQTHEGRMQLLSTPYEVYERRIREQMIEMFAGSGFDAKRDIAGIVLNRWGHAFINPQPGFFFGKNGQPAPRDALRNGPFGRIAFSHSDLAGAMDHRNAFMESNRAVNQLLDRVLT
ncbi:MAG TPA: NAD(P)-binding protein [Bryobacteraceae bacterium]|jgi:spermidine dehydrogenase|nr:NAD(P)-binding protein [Bryobacteraceae bacterium]